MILSITAELGRWAYMRIRYRRCVPPLSMTMRQVRQSVDESWATADMAIILNSGGVRRKLH